MLCQGWPSQVSESVWIHGGLDAVSKSKTKGQRATGQRGLGAGLSKKALWGSEPSVWSLTGKEGAGIVRLQGAQGYPPRPLDGAPKRRRSPLATTEVEGEHRPSSFFVEGGARGRRRNG